MTVSSAVFAVVLGAVGFVVPALADEEPKRGGTLNYMIPADAPPSFDAHREGRLRPCIRVRRFTAC